MRTDSEVARTRFYIRRDRRDRRALVALVASALVVIAGVVL